MKKLEDAALLFLRVCIGGMMVWAHGWPKLMHFSDKMGSFADPLGVGSTLSLSMAIFAEVFCAAAVVLGIGTRYAAAVLVFTMCVAAFIVHSGDPWSKQEFALLYAIPFAFIALHGAGKFALEHYIKLRRG